MSLSRTLKNVVPLRIRQALRPFRNKLNGEMGYWRDRFEIENGQFDHTRYERLMPAMAGEPDDGFLAGKIVADFGCGPRGSLAWARSAAMRIGIDVLADRYVDEFGSCTKTHGMVYLKSTERVIPLPLEFVDVMFTLNAIDHVENFSVMCVEMLRVLKPRGSFIGGFNLNESPTLLEPHRLDEELIQRTLLDQLEVETYRLRRWGPPDDKYAHFFDDNGPYDSKQKGMLWVKARKLQ